jgi:two-component system, chemotaxis family, chemotaxis protein CheY
MSKTIMIVDDSLSMRQVLSTTLRDAGFAVIEGVDGCDALDKLNKAAPDLLITDLNMPNMDGITLIQKARALPSCKTTPILMLTTETDANKKQAGRSAGATGWIVKPFQPDQLLATVRKVMR